MLRRSMSSS